MRDYCIDHGSVFRTASTWLCISTSRTSCARRVARDREVMRVPLDRGSRGRFALVQQGRQTSRRLGSSFIVSTRHQSRRRGPEFAPLAHHQGKTAHKTDMVVALGMTALAAVKAESEHTYNWRGNWISARGDPPDWLLHYLLTGGLAVARIDGCGERGRKPQLIAIAVAVKLQHGRARKAQSEHT